MNYVTDDTMNAYLRTVQPMYDGVLGEIQREAIAAEVPIIPLETARLLSVLLTMQKPKHILEIGTAVDIRKSFPGWIQKLWRRSVFLPGLK